MEVRLSIVIPAKNEEEHIGICIASLYKAVDRAKISAEIILVDNGSTDRTCEIAMAEGCKVITVKDGTISGLRNVGAAMAMGDLIGFVDADCSVDPLWVYICLNSLNDNKTGIVGTRAIPDLDNATWVEESWYEVFSGSNRPEFLNWIGTSNMMMRKELFIRTGGFDEDMQTAEDVNFCYRVKSLGKLIKLEKSINTIHHRESKTLMELFSREYKRGGSSIRSYQKNLLKWNELIGVLAPFSLVITIMACLYAIISNNMLLLFFPLVYIVLLPTVFLIRKKKYIRFEKTYLQHYLVSSTFIFARCISIISEIGYLIKSRFSKSL